MMLYFNEYIQNRWFYHENSLTFANSNSNSNSNSRSQKVLYNIRHIDQCFSKQHTVCGIIFENKHDKCDRKEFLPHGESKP